jgi:hypothetical protein
MKGSIQWDYAIPFFSWYVFRIFFFLFFSPIVVFLLVILLTGGFSTVTIESLNPGLTYAFYLLSIFVLLTIFITWLLFKNGFLYTYIVNDKGFYQISDKRQKKVNRATIVLGLLGKSTSTTGAGLLAYSGEERFISWKDAKVIKINTKKRYIYISRGRIAIGPIGMFCTPENFDKIISLIHERKS